MEAERLLIDNDAFVLFSGTDLLRQSAAVLGFGLDACLRLDTLTHMLRKGRAFKTCPDTMKQRALAACGMIESLTQRPEGPFVETLTGHEGIDLGEVLLYAALAQHPSWTLLSGDKRAMRALCSTPDLVAVRDAISGRVACVETVIDLMVKADGARLVADGLRPARQMNSMIAVVLSDGHASDDNACISANQRYISELEQDIGNTFLLRRD